MRKTLRSVALMGLAASLATGAAMAASHDSRVMTVDLPDGSVARITYSGDIAPKVRIVPEARISPVWFDPVPAAPFAMLERISRDMDRNLAAMMRQADAMEAASPAAADGMTFVSQEAMPAGTVRYSYVMTGNGRSYCSKSVRITSDGSGAKPMVVSQSSGDCGDGPAPAPAVKSQASPAQDRLPANMI